MPADLIAVPRREPGATYVAPGLYTATGAKMAGVQEKNSEARMVVEFAGVTFIGAVSASVSGTTSATSRRSAMPW